jgi:riboflavin synthase
MFTGLVETTGILRRRSGKPVARAFIETDIGPLTLGESISVNGACLTVDRIVEKGFEADMSSETLSRTTLGSLRLPSRVHLERATPLGGRMGGHMVLGHVDGVATVAAVSPIGDATRFEVRAPSELARYVAPKGSIAIDGVSLTVNEVSPASAGDFRFDVMLVPHTIDKTILRDLAPGAPVNIEVDVLARYVARQLEIGAHPPHAKAGSIGAAGITSAPPDGPSEAHAQPERQPYADQDARLLAKLRTSGYR